MNISIYRASVPTLVRMLENLGRILQKAAEFARVEGLDAAALLERRLSPDMFPLSRQVQIVVSGAKGSAARLAGRLDPLDCSPEFAVFNRGDERSFGAAPTSFDKLQELVQEGLTYVNRLSRSDFDVAPPISITVAKQDERRIFETHAFLLDYVLPNLYFHISVVYALLRSAGVKLGKQDFEGAASYGLATGAETPMVGPEINSRG